MAQKLVVPIVFSIYQGDALVRSETIAQDVIKIGRDQKSHLRVEDDSVSRMHAVIEAKPDEVQIIDLGSGTLVNGQSVNKCALKSGDEIRIGNTRIVVEVGAPTNADALAASVPKAEPGPSAAPPIQAPAFVAPPFAAPPFAGPVAGVPPVSQGMDSGHGHAASVGGEEIYQLIKRGDINPHEVEEVGGQATEVSILWKSSILHVAHLDGTKNFLLTTQPSADSKAGIALGAGLSLGAVMVIAGAAKSNYPVGIAGSLVCLAGAGVAIGLDDASIRRKRDSARFVVDEAMLQGANELPLVVGGAGSTRFVFVPGSTGEIVVDGQTRSLQELIGANVARPSPSVPGGHEVELRPNMRCKMDLGSLTVLGKVVAPGRRVAGVGRRDAAMLWSGVGSFGGIAAFVAAMLFAAADDSGFLSQGNDEDRLAELRAFIQRQQERQPEQQQQQNNDQQQEGGTGTRHAGPEGKMGRRDAPVRSARYAIRNNGEPPHMSRQAAREAVQNRGIFAALAMPGGGMSGGASGIVSPFGGLTESGLDNQNAQGNITGDAIGDAFGYGGLGAVGTGWGGGGTGEGTIGLGNIGTMGHGAGNGTGQGYGSGAGRGLRGRGTTGPLVRAAPPQVTGLLSPEAIRRVVLRNLGQVAHCHEQGLAQNPMLEGRVVVRFIIGGTGTVMGSGVVENVSVPNVGTCIANAVRRWQFPSPEGGGTVTVNYPFNLQHPE